MNKSIKKCLLSYFLIIIVIVLSFQTTAQQCVWGDWIVDKQPTCTAQGHEYRICTADPNSPHKQEQSIPMIAHKYTSAVTQSPTCTVNGIRTYKCTMCGKSYTKTIAKIAHNYKEVSRTAGDCENVGKITYKCTMCGDTYTKTTGTAGGHQYKETSTVDATCTTNGSKTYTCSVCGDSYTEEIKATGHEYELAATVEPTCQQEGVKTFICTKCGDKYDEVFSEKTAHQFKSVQVTEDGFQVTYNECSVCGTKYEVGRVEIKQFDAVAAAITAVGSADVLLLALFGFLIIPDLLVLAWYLKKKKEKKEKSSTGG